MNKKMELVSVVIPTYNRSKTIKRAIDSVLAQTYLNIEIIIVDDCSADNTENIVLENYKDNNRVKYIRLKNNLGACIARNIGIKNSKGKYVAFLDSDDVFYKDKIEKQIIAIKKSNMDLCASDYYRINKDGSKCIIKTCTNKNEIYEELLFCNFITTGTLIGKRECFEYINFDNKLPRYQDWDLVLRLSKEYSIYCLEEPTILQEYQINSITSSTNHKKTMFALKTIYKKNIDGYKNNKRACSQIKWLIGMHSMYENLIPEWKYLWEGATQYKISLKRIFIIILLKLGLANFLEKYI